MNRLIKLIAVLVVSATIATSGCVFNNTEQNEQTVEILAMSAVSQVVYSTLQKHPEYEQGYVKLVDVLKKVDTSVDMTPEDITNKVNEELKKYIPEDYVFIITGAIDAFFTKYNIGWSDKVNKDKIHSYIEDMIIAIEVAIEENKNRK